MSPKHSGLNIYEKEFIIVLMVVDKWRHYLEGGRFIIRTYHESLKFVLQQKLQTRMQKKGMSKMMGLNCTIQYRKRKENTAVDGLSRCHEEGSATPITLVVPEWYQEVMNNYEGDEKIKELLERLAAGAKKEEGYTLVEGMLRYQGTVVIGDNAELKTKIMQALLESPLGGHSGVQNIYLRVRQLFHWLGMRAEVRRFVLACDTC